MNGTFILPQDFQGSQPLQGLSSLSSSTRGGGEKVSLSHTIFFTILGCRSRSLGSRGLTQLRANYPRLRRILGAET
jgi:hypothetical protein